MTFSTLLMISSLIIMPTAAPPKPENNCRSAADCAVVEGPCANSWLAVNKVHEQEVKEKVALMKPQIACFTPQFKGTPPSVMCKNNICAIEAVKILND